MSEVTDPNVTPPVEGDGTKLPSETPAPQDYAGFELNDDMKAKFKDGKLNGRFESVQGILDKLKEVEDKHANTVRDMSDADKAALQAKTDADAAKITDATKQTALEKLIPQFVDADMVITPEIKAAAEAAGYSATEIELFGYKAKAQFEASYSEVGGKDNYTAMQAWAADGGITPAEAKAFTQDMNTSASKFAIQGLYAAFQEATKDEDPYMRIEGDAKSTGLRPYADRKELFRDKQAVESIRGYKNTDAYKRYQARLKITNPRLWN